MTTSAPATPASLPPAGPAWYSAVMGTGILSTLLTNVGGAHVLVHLGSAALLLFGWVLLVGLSVAFGVRVARDRRVLATSVRDSAAQPLWGTVSMGILAVGSATLTVLPTIVPGVGSLAVALDAVLWTTGTVIGLVTALGFTAVLVRGHVGRPVPAWGLPIVPPMVSATTGAALLPHLGSPTAQFLMLAFLVLCFVLALTVAGVVFLVGYHHHWRVAPLPVVAAASTWIPLGVVGQSAAAAQVMAGQADRFLNPTGTAAAHQLANGYGLLMLALAIPVVAHAVRMTVAGFRARMPFTPGWWALTFPVGTLSLGAHLLGASLGSTLVASIGTIALGVLVGTWALCTVSTARAVVLAPRGGQPGGPGTRPSAHQVGVARSAAA